MPSRLGRLIENAMRRSFSAIDEDRTGSLNSKVHAYMCTGGRDR